MRTKHKVYVKIADDADMKDGLFTPDDTLAEVILDVFHHQNSGTVHVAAGTTLTIPFGHVTAVKGCFLKLDNDCLLTLNDSTTDIQLRAQASYAKFFLEGDLSKVEITAPAEDSVEGFFCVWGDLTA